MIIRDAWLIALANSLTSIFAGFVVFGTLGMLAQVNRIWLAPPGALYVTMRTMPCTHLLLRICSFQHHNSRSKLFLRYQCSQCHSKLLIFRIRSYLFDTIPLVLKIIYQNNGVAVEDVITGGEGLTFQVIT